MLLAKLNQIGHPRHGAVVVHDLADHSRRHQPGHPRQIHRSLRLPRPHQHPTLARPQRKHMSRPRQIMRRRSRINRHLDRMRAIRSRDPRRHAFTRLDALGKCRAKPRSILLRHRPQPQIVRAFFRQRQADQPAAILRHKVDRLGSNKLRSQRQVAFILAVLIIDDHDHPARLDLRHRLGHVSKHNSAFHLHLFRRIPSYVRRKKERRPHRRRLKSNLRSTA